jgi:hypothetical protein
MTGAGFDEFLTAVEASREEYYKYDTSFSLAFFH